MVAASDTFTFIGQQTTGWYRYRDAATGSMLVADPGGTYQIRPLEPDLPVPPDGQWVAAFTASPPAKAKASTSETAPPQAEGSGN